MPLPALPDVARAAEAELAVLREAVERLAAAVRDIARAPHPGPAPAAHLPLAVAVARAYVDAAAELAADAADAADAPAPTAAR